MALLEKRITKIASEISLDMPREIIVLLDSGGGDLEAANDFVTTARQLSERHNVKIHTQVKRGSCESACTVLFTAGDERIASRRASFGFHTPGIKGKVPGHTSRSEILAKGRKLWIDAIARVDYQFALMIETKRFLFHEEFSYVWARELNTGYITILE